MAEKKTAYSSDGALEDFAPALVCRHKHPLTFVHSSGNWCCDDMKCKSTTDYDVSLAVSAMITQMKARGVRPPCSGQLKTIMGKLRKLDLTQKT